MSMDNYIATICPVCLTDSFDKELYAANLKDISMDAKIFSARRPPDKVHYRMVYCQKCHLVRSNPVLQTSVLNQLYQESHFEYDQHVTNLVKTYEHVLLKCINAFGLFERLLDVGCGNGFLMDGALRLGTKEAYGLELSTEAVKMARPETASHIITKELEWDTFPKNYFDIICFFQVLDHLPNPVEFLKICKEILKPGGIVLIFNHNIDAFSSKILGEKSPIVDVEHTFLYSPYSINEVLTKAGFSKIQVHTAFNRHSSGYLSYLLPYGVLKNVSKTIVNMGHLQNCNLWMPIGNMWASAVRL